MLAAAAGCRTIHAMQVLDDNKKLCLVSGEIIQLSSTMTMMFEVEDLAVASPATVSRCGMVYMEPSSLGLTPLLDSWLETLFGSVSEHVPLLRRMFNALVPDMIRFVRKHTKETVATVDSNLCISCFRLLDSLLLPFRQEEAIDNEACARLAASLPQLMLFSIVWSVGGSCDKGSRPRFDTALRNRVTTCGCTVPLAVVCFGINRVWLLGSLFMQLWRSGSVDRPGFLDALARSISMPDASLEYIQEMVRSFCQQTIFDPAGWSCRTVP
jgi:hypothetical protein